MSSLNSALSIATQSLQAQELEIQVSNNNIANVNTPGYTREIVNLSETSSTQDGSVNVGNGVTIDGIESVRDDLLSLRIQQQTSQQSAATAQVNALNEIQTLFPSSGSSLASSLSTFFTSLSSLSSNPTSTADRQTVLEGAQSVVDQFHSISSSLSGSSSSLNTTVTTDVAKINELSTQAASLNQELVQQQGQGQSTGVVTDQLDEVEQQLAAVTNVAITHTSQGDTITTGNGSPLVLGNQSYSLVTKADASGNQQIVDSSGTTITSTISSGDLGGTLQVRDTQIPGLLKSLNTLANEFATSFNSAQSKGYDQNGKAGAALFTIPTTVAGSAAGIALATNDPTKIAASSNATSGSNGNVANLTAVQSAAQTSGQTVSEQSSNLVYQVGNLTANATAEQTAIEQSLSSLNSQQGSISGVSIDEESANLIQYEQAYQAAAKVVSTIQSLFDTTINMIN